MSPETTTILLIALIVASARGQTRNDDDDSDADDHRLPRDTEPVAYGLRMAPKYDANRGRYEYSGQVEILLKANRYTWTVTLNAKDIQITSAELVEYKTQTSIDVDKCVMIPEKEWLVVYPARSLLQGRQYQLKLVFQGLLRTDMTGFYRSTYRVNDVSKWMAVSQFKPTYARRAFPCYDEPGYKTPFNVSLGRQGYQTTLSNMPCYSSQRLEYYGWWVDHFETTPPIPTYLVGVFVGELKKSVQVEGTDVDVYTYGDYLTQGNYAMEETPSLYESMENFTKSTSEVVKMDYLAVPDFNADGTENWGLHAFRERYVLLDDDSKTKFKEQSTMIIEQQQSRQWFGNLVTCSWWDYLWLSEGFARYFQYFGTDAVKPDWRLEDLFVVEQHQTALEFDQIPRHPVTATVRTSEDAQSIFDRVTYNKAAAILRMIRHTVTESNFQEPLVIYLQNFKYGAASADDLWAVFENYYFDNGYQLKAGPTEVSFTDFVHSFTDQPGYPVVHVTKTSREFRVTQSRFSIWPSDGDDTAGWYIPLTYTTDLTNDFDDLSPVRWMNPTQPDSYIKDDGNYSWFMFNLQCTGFYRVNYDKSNWDRLVSLLNVTNSTVHVRNRAQLIDDSFNLARAGMLDYATALDVSTYLRNEDDYVPWYTTVDCLSYVVERMRRSAEGYQHIKSYVRNLAEIIYKKTEEYILLYELKDHSTMTSWNKFSVWACYMDSEYCTKKALINYNRWSKNEKISPDIKDAAFCTGIKKNDDRAAWYRMLDVYTTTKSASEKNSAQSALACSRDAFLLNKYLAFLNDTDAGGPVRLQDYKDICDAMSSTPQGIEVLTNYLMGNIEGILRTVPTGESIVTYMYWLLANKVALDSEIIKLYNLKNAPNLPPKIKASFEASYVHVEQNLRWYDNYHLSINEWTGAPAEPNSTTLATTTESPSTTSNDTTTDESRTEVSTSPSTEGSTSPLTEGSISSSTEGSTSSSTEGSTSPLTEGSTSPLTEGSTSSSTEGSTSSSTEGSTSSSTEGSTSSSTEGSTSSSTEGSTSSSTEGSTSPSTEGSTSPSTEGSTSPSIEGSTSSSTEGSTPMSTQPKTTIKMFDFDHTTPGSISRCPEKSDARSSRLSGLALVIVTATAVIVSSNLNAMLRVL